MARFSMELRELNALSSLSNLNRVPDTQLDTQALIHEMSMDSEVTLRKVLGLAKILPLNPGLDPFEDTRPIETPSDSSGMQVTPITATSPSVIAAPSRMPLGPALSYHTLGPSSPLQWSHHTSKPGSLHWSSYHTADPTGTLHKAKNTFIIAAQFVRPSICPLHSYIMSKRLSSFHFLHVVAPPFAFPDDKYCKNKIREFFRKLKPVKILIR